MDTQIVNKLNSKTLLLTRMFNFQGHEVRAVITRANETLFSLNDVCECCDIQRGSNASSALRERFSVEPKALESGFDKGCGLTATLNESGDVNYTSHDSKEQQSEQSISLSAQLDKLTDDLCYFTEARENSAFYACDDVQQDANDPIKAYTVETAGGMQKMLFITEPQLYFVMFRGRSDMAKAFSLWVCNEVLPSIRKYGYYRTEQKKGITLPEVPVMNEQGSYPVTYPQMLATVEDYYQIDEKGRALLQWITKRASAQGYALAKSKENEATDQLIDMKAALFKAKREAVEAREDLEKLEKEFEKIRTEDWKLIDDTQVELSDTSKKLAVYESAVKALLEDCSNAPLKSFVKTTMDCMF